MGERCKAVVMPRRARNWDLRGVPALPSVKPGVRGNVLSFGDFSLHEQRKVTRSAAGRVEALLLKERTGLHATPVACPSAIRCANVRSPHIADAMFDLPPQSSLRWNDEHEIKRVQTVR